MGWLTFSMEAGAGDTAVVEAERVVELAAGPAVAGLAAEAKAAAVAVREAAGVKAAPVRAVERTAIRSVPMATQIITNRERSFLHSQPPPPPISSRFMSWLKEPADSRFLIRTIYLRDFRKSRANKMNTIFWATRPRILRKEVATL